MLCSCWFFSLFPRMKSPSFQNVDRSKAATLDLCNPCNQQAESGWVEIGERCHGMWKNMLEETNMWKWSCETYSLSQNLQLGKNMWKNCIVCHVWPTRILDAYSHIYCEQNDVPFGVPSSRVGSSYSILTLHSFCRGHSYLGCIPAPWP